MDKFINFLTKFKSRSRHHSKLTNFIVPELLKIERANILEFGVSEKCMSTELFLNYCNFKECKLFSIDVIDYSQKFKNKKWEFIKARDDNFEYVSSCIPKKIDLILLDTIHEAKHVEKILYYYYDYLSVNSCFFIDDISWLPYLKDADKNRFYAEINNHETFIKLLEIYNNNKLNLNIEFTFEGTGICKIKKLNDNKLNIPKDIKSRNFSIKNLIRKAIR